MDRPASEGRLFSTFRFLLLIVSIVFLGSAPIAHAGTYGEPQISSVQFQPNGSLDYTVGLSWEGDRELTGGSGSEYDNLRARPLDIRYGYSDRFQFGASLTHSSNSSSNRGLDNGGLDNLSLRSKYKWNRNFAIDLMLGYGLNQDVFPYGGDGPIYGINFPFQTSLGPGYLIGDLGYTVNNEQVSESVEWGNFLNYGLGYRYQMTRKWGIRAEIFGHGATVDPEKNSAKSSMEMKITPSMRLNETSELRPSLSYGFSDGSPDFALGLEYTVRFGVQSDRRVRLDDDGDPIQSGEPSSGDEETIARETSEEENDQPLLLPDDSTETGPEESVRDPERAQSLSQKGRTAFEEGNRDRALTLFEEALQYDPENVQVLSNLGSLHYRKGNLDQAEQYYRQAIDVKPTDQYAQLYLGIVLQKRGKTEEALKHLRKARDIDPMSEPGQTAAERINQLQP